MTKKEKQILEKLNLTIDNFKEIREYFDDTVTEISDLEKCKIFKNKSIWEKYIKTIPYRLNWLTNEVMNDFINWEKFIESYKKLCLYLIFDNGMVIVEPGMEYYYE